MGPAQPAGGRPATWEPSDRCEWDPRNLRAGDWVNRLTGMSASCPLQGGEAAELLLAYCARRLDAETRAWLERHVQLCPECGALAEQQRTVWEALDYWDALPISEEFDARLHQRIRRAAQLRPFAAANLWRAFHLPLAAASVLLGALLFLRSPGPLGPAPESVGPAEVESVEAALEDMEMLRALELFACAGAPRAECV